MQWDKMDRFLEWKSDVGDNPMLAKAPKHVMKKYEYIQFWLLW